MKDYKVYKCYICSTVFIIPVEYIKRPGESNRYLACPYGHRKIKEAGAYDDLKLCMDNHVYKRERGSIKQIK